jgi:diguanylate cyclase (GGDEF)-like protein
MTSKPLRILAVTRLGEQTLRAAETSAYGPFLFDICPDGQAVQARFGHDAFDAVIFDATASDDIPDWIEHTAIETAVLVVSSQDGPAALVEWLRLGVQDVLTPDELATAHFAQRLRAAIERKSSEGDIRRAYATDLGTGLPHQQQLIEHMSHLLALREREPAPMAVLVLRVEGLETTEARMGLDAANVLRRKLAVRLRAGVRASDVVAALGDDSFGILLASILSPADAQHVGDKLSASLQTPFKVQGQDIAVAAALGIGQYPQDGSQPTALLNKAMALAASTLAQGRAGLSNFLEAGGRAPGAANDE